MSMSKKQAQSEKTARIKNRANKNTKPPIISRDLTAVCERYSVRRLWLYGSILRPDFRPDSDIDVLVVERRVKDRVAEMVRLGRVISPLRMPVDLLVVDEEAYEYWSEVPGNVYYEAHKKGTALYEAA